MQDSFYYVDPFYAECVEDCTTATVAVSEEELPF